MADFTPLGQPQVNEAQKPFAGLIITCSEGCGRSAKADDSLIGRMQGNSWAHPWQSEVASKTSAYTGS